MEALNRDQATRGGHLAQMGRGGRRDDGRRPPRDRGGAECVALAHLMRNNATGTTPSSRRRLAAQHAEAEHTRASAWWINREQLGGIDSFGERENGVGQLV